MKNKKRLILLVEDEAVIALTQETALKEHGYEVITVHSGEKAVESVKEHQEIDLILMDIELGSGIDGTEAAAIILKERDIPVLFCSSHSDPETVEKTEKITSFGYVMKSSPVSVIDASIKMAFKLFYEISERKRVERNRLALASLVDNSNDVAVVKDLDRRIITANKRFVQETTKDTLSELLGKRDAEILGISEDEEPAHSFKLDDLQVLDMQPGDQLVREEDVPADEGSMRTHMTRKFPICMDSKLIGIGVISTDITERKMMEEELKSSNALLSMIMETSPVGITTVDTEGSITYANYRAEQILGLEKDEITARNYDSPEWRHIDVDGGPFPDEKQPFSIVKTTGKPAYNIRHGIVWPDGRTVMLSINASPMRDKEGRFTGMVATFEDITDKLENEKTITRQLAEKELLLKEVHHRIKNNLSSVEGLVSMQLESIRNPEALSVLQDTMGRIGSMRILYEKLLTGENYNDTSVKTYLTSISNAVIGLFSADGKVDLDIQIDEFNLPSNRLFSVGIVINELLTNIMKYAFRGRDHGLIKISFTRSGRQALLSVQDDGNGIPVDFSLEESSGFGLRLVEMLSKALDGTFSIENDRGTKTVVEFPL